jgi:hypothetical protein
MITARSGIRVFAAFVLSSVSGCMLVQPPAGHATMDAQAPQMGMETLSTIEQHFVRDDGSPVSAGSERPETGNPASSEVLNNVEEFLQAGDSQRIVDPALLQPGHHVRLLISDEIQRERLNDGEPQMTRVTQTVLPGTIMGTVQSVSPDSVTLQNVVMRSYEIRTLGTPLTRHVPFAARLFTNTERPNHHITRIPGEVTIKRVSVAHVTKLTETEMQDLYEKSQTQRIGVDFDFSSPQSVVRTVHEQGHP